MNSLPIVHLPCPVPWRPMLEPYPIERYENILMALTNWCPVGCSFCFMEAVPQKAHTIRLGADAIGRVLRFINQHAVPILDLTGGEALSELDTVVRILKEVDAERVSISTSGYFATDSRRTERVLDELADALAVRADLGKPHLIIDFRISADEFHWHISSRVLGCLLEAFERHHTSRYRQIQLELRGILSKNDPVPKFVRSRNGRIDEDPTGARFPLKRITFPSGHTFTIKYGELKLTDSLLATAVAETEFDKIFGKRVKEETIFIGKGRLGGVSFSVSHDGVVALQEFLAREYPLANVNTEAFSDDIQRRLTLDPLVVGLRTLGLNTIMAIAENRSPGIMKKSIDANNQFMAVLRVVGDKEIREHVYDELTKRLGSTDSIRNEECRTPVA